MMQVICNFEFQRGPKAWSAWGLCRVGGWIHLWQLLILTELFTFFSKICY